MKKEIKFFQLEEYGDRRRHFNFRIVRDKINSSGVNIDGFILNNIGLGLEAYDKDEIQYSANIEVEYD